MFFGKGRHSARAYPALHRACWRNTGQLEAKAETSVDESIIEYISKVGAAYRRGLGPNNSSSRA